MPPAPTVGGSLLAAGVRLARANRQGGIQPPYGKSRTAGACTDLIQRYGGHHVAKNVHHVALDHGGGQRGDRHSLLAAAGAGCQPVVNVNQVILRTTQWMRAGLDLSRYTTAAVVASALAARPSMRWPGHTSCRMRVSQQALGGIGCSPRQSARPGAPPTQCRGSRLYAGGRATCTAAWSARSHSQACLRHAPHC
jgi:hypothetical protein